MDRVAYALFKSAGEDPDYLLSHLRDWGIKQEGDVQMMTQPVQAELAPVIS